jgi:hypothetical protein
MTPSEIPILDSSTAPESFQHICIFMLDSMYPLL